MQKRGHDCGDEVLKFVANTVSAIMSNRGKVFRWGGEEILVLMEAGKEKAYATAEKIRLEIENQPVNYRNKTEVGVTVTIGLTAFDSELDLKGMMDLVDERLYVGKRSGKNQVVCGTAN